MRRSGRFRTVRFLLLAAISALFLSGCGGDSGAANSDVCARQATDLADVRELTDRLGQPDSHWGPGGPDAATATAGDAVEALTGYVPDNAKVTRAVDTALDAVQALYDDLADDGTLSGTGQTAKTARAALEALATTCG